MKQFFFIVWLWSTTEGSYRLYHSHYHLLNNDHDCFYRFENGSDDLARHLVPYCIRHTRISLNKECFGTKYTFHELLSKNITSQELWKWFAPIDLIDDYAVYLLTSSSNDNNKQIYCNCSDRLSFGAQCQYRFIVGNEDSSFDEIVNLTIMTNQFNENNLYWIDEQSSTTCYMHFNCTTYSGFCLDWREISDGFAHCTNGIDEEYFVTMEQSNCDSESEYRCRHGLCIPRSFLLDRTFDCPDWYDEQVSRSGMRVDMNRACPSKLATAECEEYKLGLNFFSCGDGQHLGIRFFGTHDCSNFRNVLILKSLFRPYFNQSLNDSCYLTMMCLFNVLCLFQPCPNGIKQHCEKLLSINDKTTSCRSRFFFPPGPFVFPFVRLLYTPRKLWDTIYPDFVCWNRSVCNIYDDTSVFLHEGFDCVKASKFYFHLLTENYEFIFYLPTGLMLMIQSLFSHCTHQNQESDRNMYTCSSQLFISSYRVLDREFDDCFPWVMLKEEEDFTDSNRMLACDLPDRFVCGMNDACVPRRSLHAGYPYCKNCKDQILSVKCTDEFACQYLRELDMRQGSLYIYQDICDGIKPVCYGAQVSTLDDTDETDCEMWPCQASHTLCNGWWNRPNGCDELTCPSSHKGSCGDNEHPCAHFNSTMMGCLPLVKAGDGDYDCLFGTDERATLLKYADKHVYNRSTGLMDFYQFYFLPCWNHFNVTIEPNQLCDRIKNCPLGDDELFCDWHQNSTCHNSSEFTCKNGTCISKATQWCNGIIDCAPEGEDERLCDILKTYRLWSGFPPTVPKLPVSFDHFIPIERRLILSKNPIQCHRGIVIHNQADNIDECLCPPSYHGTNCERQSERLSVFYRVDISPSFDRRFIHQLVFYLLDENGKVLTHETMIHTTFNEQFSLKHLIYLNYPRSLHNYSMFSKKFVRIDTYPVSNKSVEPVFLSWLYSVQFSAFLPVTRISVLLYLEELSSEQLAHCRNFNTCQHGVCQVYVNSNVPFCRCKDGWFGSMCDQRQSIDICAKLICSQFSRCVVYNDHAFCLCVLGRVGRTCEISFDTCNSTMCKNDGMCVSLDKRTIPQACFCPILYFGDRCQYTSAELKLNIPSNISPIPMLIIHFLHSPVSTPGILLHHNFFFFRNVHPNTQLTIYHIGHITLPPFVFAQIIDLNSFYGSYYLLLLSNTNRTNITIQFRQTYNCPHVNQYLNSTLINAPWLKRIKFYHLYMKNVKCFYDEAYMCLIDKNGIPNCFIYNHNVTNCIEREYCVNGGRCLEQKKLGQLNYKCVCPQCTSGKFCQHRMSEYSLTLDTLLGQMIVTDVSLHAQPIIIKVLLGLCVLMIIIGFISNICSFITFCDKDIRKIGCGYYLLILSISNQITMCIFVARVIYLIYSQLVIIDNWKVLNASCRLFDFILQVSISFCAWLHTCIACERTVTAVKGVNFNKRQSVYMAKIVVPVLLVMMILTSIHHVFNRDLVDDPHLDGRLWCVIKHRHTWLHTYEICMNIFNSIVPLLINLISGIILVISLSNTRQRVAVKERYETILISQIIQHKDLLIAPATMIVTSIPLLIVSIAIRCVSEQLDIYASLATYLLSLTPLISTFFIFIWPSNSYMSKFKVHFRYFKNTKQKKRSPRPLHNIVE